MVGLDFWMWPHLLLYSRLPPSNQWTSPLVWLPLFLPGFTSRATLVPVDPTWGFWKRAEVPQNTRTHLWPKGHDSNFSKRACHSADILWLCCYHTHRTIRSLWAGPLSELQTEYPASHWYPYPKVTSNANMSKTTLTSLPSKPGPLLLWPTCQWPSPLSSYTS